VHRLAIVLAVAVVAGCGSSKSRPAAESRMTTESKPVVLRPLGPVGRWTKLILSPDTKTYLAQWMGECEALEAFFIPAAGGKPRPVTGRRGDEVVALGWALHNRARVLVPRAACGGQFGTPGIYLVGRHGEKPVLVKRIKARLGGP
jgi:hypothetical protein